MVVRYPVYRLVEKLLALAWSGHPPANHALAQLEAQVDRLLLDAEHRPVPPPPPTQPVHNHWPGEF